MQLFVDLLGRFMFGSFALAAAIAFIALFVLLSLEVEPSITLY